MSALTQKFLRNPSLLWSGGILLAYAYFCYLMLDISLQYIPFDTDVAFLRIKQDYIGREHYRIAFFTHVYTSFFCLLAGFTQFSPYVRKKLPALHRSGGWLYALSILFLAAPSGFIIGIYANGGLPSQIAFCLLAVCWIWTTGKAIWEIKQRNFQAHRFSMIRSFALTMSAITLRAWKYIIVALFHPRPMDVYMIVAWLGWVLNLLVAEYIIYRLKK